MSPSSARHPSLDELSAWADGEVGGQLEHRVLAEHVEGCASCASLVEDFRAMAAAQAAAVVPPVPPRLERRVREALVRDGKPARSAGRRLMVPLSAAATALVAVAALWLWRQQPGPPVPSLEERAPAPAPAVQPEPDAAPPPPPAAQTQPAPTVRKKIEKQEAAAPAPAPPPAPPPQEEVVAGGALGDLATAHRWTRISSPQPRIAEELRREAAPDAPAPAPSETESAGAAADASASYAAADREACPVMDQLRPPLTAPGLDAARGEAVAQRARGAGATAATLDPGPRLTLLVPARAWPQVRGILAASGVEIPPAAAEPPQDAACLLVEIAPGP